MDNSIDEMIKRYSDALMGFAKKHNAESLAVKKSPDKSEPEGAKTDTLNVEAKSAEKNFDLTSENAELIKEIPDEDDMESFAYFRGRVFSGGEAYPVEKAGVTLYKNDILYAFLVTDKNGETAKIKIEAYPEKNSLEPLSEEQTTEYRADVFADGFLPKENLLVSALGGSDVVLEAELTPESEGIT